MGQGTLDSSTPHASQFLDNDHNYTSPAQCQRFKITNILGVISPQHDDIEQHHLLNPHRPGTAGILAPSRTTYHPTSLPRFHDTTNTPSVLFHGSIRTFQAFSSAISNQDDYHSENRIHKQKHATCYYILTSDTDHNKLRCSTALSAACGSALFLIIANSRRRLSSPESLSSIDAT